MPDPIPSTAASVHRRKHHSTEPIQGCGHCQKSWDHCCAKISYMTRQMAEAAVNDIHEKEQFTEPVRRYHCRWCANWHIGHAWSPVDLKRVERAKRKWLERQALGDT
jgi:hypothetical protein